MKKVSLALVFVLVALPALAGYPMGTYEWVDNWGNNICKSFDSGQTRSIQGSTEDCPAGTHPWVDSWGNPVCQKFNSRQKLYDTSKGCPVGTYEWIDRWGNPVCKKF